ncbi:hypothetical protein Lser_V15G00096 [Lactuca serriola]
MEFSNVALILQILLMGLVIATPDKPICQRTCGNVTIPYPFGTEEGCYMDQSYYIECNPTTQIPRLHGSSSLVFPYGVPINLRVLEVKMEGQLRVSLPIAHTCFNSSGKIVSGDVVLVQTLRFPFSSTLNWFTGVGCGIRAHLELAKPVINMNCPTKCPNFLYFQNGTCLGHGCCRATIPQGMTISSYFAITSRGHQLGYFKCGYAFIVEKDKYYFDKIDLRNMRHNLSFPVVLDWSVGVTNCEEARKNNVNYMCQENSVCYDHREGGLSGYRCKCSDGYEGNPYMANGCKDINECESAKLNDCMAGHCENTNGSYTCVCPKGHLGNARLGGKCTSIQQKSENRSVIEGISEGVGGAAVAMIFAYWGLKQRKLVKVRKDFFKQNGGIMLQKTLFTCKDPVNQAKIFTEVELKKATKNFNEANVIGQGGYGTVFKGILADKTLIAIKKSKVIDQSQIKQFVNEVIILSQINHQNIVKLLGCCLETPVPLLVYEYITNSTLGYHIHTHAMLTFGKRLKIAAETAEALAYMHSTTQIIHRDVKPSNILLNDEFTAKVSDFGISRFVPLGETHLSTIVKGTIGYMDPEYFRTCKLTEKSDVYSFGVVLIELLTRTKIHSLEISLRFYKGAAAYLASLIERDVLVQVLDDQLQREEYAEVVKCVAKIAINCLDLEGKTRPTMKEVKQELEKLRCVLSSIEAESL